MLGVSGGDGAMPIKAGTPGMTNHAAKKTAKIWPTRGTDTLVWLTVRHAGGPPHAIKTESKLQPIKVGSGKKAP